ncbi:MAG: hypothetical protein LBH71_01885 [Oscillospiraceae bacterium]|nr:hypothetical protein [Oscillospiraceae bacterium]
MQVQVLLSAPNAQNPNHIFPVGEGFGFVFFFSPRWLRPVSDLFSYRGHDNEGVSCIWFETDYTAQGRGRRYRSHKS